MKAQKKRMGRPTKAPLPGKKMALGLRVTAEVKSALDAEARRSGRTQSQEAELRIERTFRDEQQLPQTLEAIYGRQLAGLLLVLARVMRDTGMSCGFANTLKPEGATNWPAVPYAYDQVVVAVNRVLESFRPEGDRSAPVLRLAAQNRAEFERVARIEGKLLDDAAKGAAAVETYYARIAHMGEVFANGALGDVINPDRGGESGEWARPIREQLGPLIDRIQHLAVKPAEAVDAGARKQS